MEYRDVIEYIGKIGGVSLFGVSLVHITPKIILSLKGRYKKKKESHKPVETENERFNNPTSFELLSDKMANYTLILQGHFERTDNPRDHTRNFVEQYLREAEIPRENQEITVPRDYFNQLLAERNLQWLRACTPKEEDHVFQVTQVSHTFSGKGLEHRVVAHYRIRVGDGD